MTATPERIVLSRAAIGGLWDWLSAESYRIVGPTVRDGAIVYDDIERVEDLPIGWTDRQEAGKYRLERRGDEALFGYAVGPHSWKKYLFPARRRLWKAERDDKSFRVEADPTPETRYAFFGARSCELHAIAIQDKVFTGKAHTDPHYQALRENVFIVAVNCREAGGTCFCVSMKTGPRATFGFDVVLTEILEPGRHEFVLEAGSDRGKRMVAALDGRRATAADESRVEAVVASTAAHMGRTMETGDIKELLYSNFEHPRWTDVASRCLNCANCTLACPTCFCSTVEDTTDLTGDHAERWRRWDSCFTVDFSYLHGGSVRPSPVSRYRQWMTHKLATWHDQFGTSGCVGCGRCLTWCPVAIDITEEVKAIRTTEPADG